MTISPSVLDPGAVQYLRGLKEHGVQLGLERMREFLQTLGNPQERVPTIHIAGTNGKGSVAAMLEAILCAAGWRTGLYTSPHLVRLGERIQVNRAPIGGSEISKYVEELRPLVESDVLRRGAIARPSYFEFMTALAFNHFARAKCDIAVIEVGMGGRLDATNVITPELSVITSIGLDHVEFLGNSLAAIAAEKAGIIKPGRPVVIGRLPIEAEEVIRSIAASQQAPIRAVVEEFGGDPSRYPTTNLEGVYQRVNAATASLAARQLGPRWRVTNQVISKGLMKVEWAGRWQRVEVGGRPVIVDASHNAEGAESLDSNLAKLAAETGSAPIVVTGILGAARARPLLDVICRHARAVYLVVPRQRRACQPEELQSLMPKDFRGQVVRSSVEAIFPAPNVCLPREPTNETVVVTGSIYLAGEVLARIDPGVGPVEHDLQDF